MFDSLDIHALKAAEFFKIPVEQVTREQRRVGKALNFGLLFSGRNGREKDLARIRLAFSAKVDTGR